MSTPPFLTAEWRSLVMWNVAVDKDLLRPHVPAGTELDLWNGEALISLVGFRFLNTRLKGWPIPLHQDFSEINLRLYVRRRVGTEWRRGVVFIKEVVPLPAVSFVARYVYGENYVTRRMRHLIDFPGDAQAGRMVYEWRDGRQWLRLAAEVEGTLMDLPRGSDAEFILEHYWGYTSRRHGLTGEYAVEHPRWRIWPRVTGVFTGDATAMYGKDFAEALKQPPRSIIAAEGSQVMVRTGTRLPRE